MSIQPHVTHDPTPVEKLRERSLHIERVFTKDGIPVEEMFSWKKFDCAIKDESGNVVFEQHDIEAPESWSQQAVDIVASKYFRGHVGSPDREGSVRDMIRRVVASITGFATPYFDRESQIIFRDELWYMLLNQMASFNSPVWFNVGVTEQPQCSACFILSVEDSMSSIMDLAKTEAMLFKNGSGTGSNLSKLRAAGEKLSGGGTASGPLSFMKGFDSFAGVIKSGGRTRRAAKMVILNADHPDIEAFVDSKMVEERKAHALIDSGFDGSFNVEGGAYDSVQFQNANHSVRVPNEFMSSVLQDNGWELRKVTTGEVLKKMKARDLMTKIAEAAWSCGDPGIQFDTTINEWNPCADIDRINASNPCSEYVFLDNTSCNLASMNLLKFYENGEFQVDDFEHACRVMITAQESLVSNAGYPTEQIAKNSEAYRPLGIGFANLGALLMRSGLAYGSEEGREMAGAIASIMTGAGYSQSARIANVVGPFSEYRHCRSSFRKVIEQHKMAAGRINHKLISDDLYAQANDIWQQAMVEGTSYGFRNAQISVIAPTGTIAFMMDCDTTGIEPDIALVKYKKLVGGGMMKIVNQSVEPALRKLGYSESERKDILAHIDENGTVDGSATLRPEHRSVFLCAFGDGDTIHWKDHVAMMAAVQPFISGAISKTVNMPNSATVEDIRDAYIEAWSKGLKCIAIYRDGCKRSQPLSTKKGDSVKEKDRSHEITKDISVTNGNPNRRRLPDTRTSVTHKFVVGGHEGYLTVGLYEDGDPGEIFIRMAKEGGTLSGLIDSFATMVSIALQSGVPLESLVKKFAHTRFEPSGWTGNEKIGYAKSILDYIFRWMEMEFIAENEKPESSSDAPSCHDCGYLMIRNGTCYRCINCGETSGCS